MSYVTALAHIVGSALVSVWIASLERKLQAWHAARHYKKVRGEFALRLGIPESALQSESNWAMAVKLWTDRSSNELLVNRLADFCDVLAHGWTLLAVFSQLASAIAVLWFTFADDLRYAVFAWAVVVIALIGWLGYVGFSLVCSILLGRYPGEPKNARAWLADIQSQAVRRI